MKAVSLWADVYINCRFIFSFALIHSLHLSSYIMILSIVVASSTARVR